MKINSMYKVKLKSKSHVYDKTVALYRDAVNFFIYVALENWNKLKSMDGINPKLRAMEILTHTTSRNKPTYPFDSKFYKFPSYLRRSAISMALGKVSSYKSNYADWEIAGKLKNPPGVPSAGRVFPCLFRENMYNRISDYKAQIKVFIRNTWDWITVSFRKSDVDYIIHHCKSLKECAPMFVKRHNTWYLDFCFEQNVVLCDTDISNRRILAVDLGINNACVCSVMNQDGTVLGRKFLKLSRENDCLNHKLSHLKGCQRHGSRKLNRQWRRICCINNGIAAKTSQFIADIAALYSVDTIVFEYLDTSGKKKGSKKQRLALWNKCAVQEMTTHKAHAMNMHISHINARYTSRLAFDGSGEVKRGNQSRVTGNNYSLCEFASGKVYHCDLNASYNIGSRYLIRELLKTLPAKVRRVVQAKVPESSRRSASTLSTLKSLLSVLTSPALLGNPLLAVSGVSEIPTA